MQEFCADLALGNVMTEAETRNAMAFGVRVVWATSGQLLLRINPARLAIVARIRLPGITGAVAVDGSNGTPATRRAGTPARDAPRITTGIRTTS
jgi:hypothetical protein